jgi:hypothetical protein
MPWTRSGKCVYKKKADGSQGKKKGCSDSEEKAKKYMSKLYSLDETDLDETDPMFLGGGGAEEEEGVPMGELYLRNIIRRLVDAFRVVVDEIYDDPQVSAGMKNTFARITLSNFDEVMENFGARGAWSPEESGTIPPWAVPFYPIGQAREAEGAAGNQIGLGELAMRICYSNLEFEPKASARTDLVADGACPRRSA